MKTTTRGGCLPSPPLGGAALSPVFFWVVLLGFLLLLVVLVFFPLLFGGAAFLLLLWVASSTQRRRRKAAPPKQERPPKEGRNQAAPRHGARCINTSKANQIRATAVVDDERGKCHHPESWANDFRIRDHLHVETRINPKHPLSQNLNPLPEQALREQSAHPRATEAFTVHTESGTATGSRSATTSGTRQVSARQRLVEKVQTTSGNAKSLCRRTQVHVPLRPCHTH